MCFDHDSRPPIAPISGAAVDHEDVTLTASDGNRFAGFRARPSAPTGAGIVILPDVRGLHRYYEELALRFAEAGVDALAIDYFGRTAGVGKREEGFDYQEHVAQLTWEGVQADIRAAAEALSPDVGGGNGTGGAADGASPSLFTVGFCMGGRLSFDAATLDVPLAGVIGFYGWPVGPHRSGSPAPADAVDQFSCAVLGLFGGADQGIPTAAVDQFEQALTNSNVDHEIVTYPGAPHSFFDRKATEFAGESEDAWARVRGFIETHTAVRA
jgi:carboxymethylenebutenolidase